MRSSLLSHNFYPQITQITQIQNKAGSKIELRLFSCVPQVFLWPFVLQNLRNLRINSGVATTEHAPPIFFYGTMQFSNKTNTLALS
jgi:hypothetical protein